MHRLRDIAINISVSLASIVLFLALFEFVVFRFIWLAADAPRLDYVNDVVRYAPHQQGVWRIRNELAAPYRINGQGWNSGVGDYARERRVGTLRIAVVGDSFIEALQVATTDSVAEVLGRNLSNDSHAVEVYRFGIGGAPLSQYVHIIEKEVASYRPDWIVVNVVHNDFDESYQFVQGRYTSSFMKFRIENGRAVGELPPTPWRATSMEFLRRTATARFFLYRWQVRPQLVVDFFLPRAAKAAATHAGVDRAPAPHPDLVAVADYGTARLAAVAKSLGASLLIVMDGDRHRIYTGDTTSPAFAYNRMMAAAASKHDVALLDLHPLFAAHWAANRRPFNFATDWHWNELGHSLAGTAIAEHIKTAR